MFSSKNVTEDQTQDFLGSSVVVLLPIMSSEEESLAESWILDVKMLIIGSSKLTLTLSQCWFKDCSGAGKHTICYEVEFRSREINCYYYG